MFHSYVQDKKMIEEKKPGFFLQLGGRPVWEKAGFLAIPDFLSCTQLCDSDLIVQSDWPQNFARSGSLLKCAGYLFLVGSSYILSAFSSVAVMVSEILWKVNFFHSQQI